jgi:hypothetical protein
MGHSHERKPKNSPPDGSNGRHGESLVNVAFALALVALATFAMVIDTWKIARIGAP